MKFVFFLLLVFVSVIMSADMNEHLPKIGADEKVTIATLTALGRLCRISENQKLSVTGVAGYIDDKSGEACLWLQGSALSVIVSLDKWPAQMLGRKVTVIGSVALRSAPPADAQARNIVPGEVILNNIHLPNGDKLGSANSSAENSPFGK